MDQVHNNCKKELIAKEQCQNYVSITDLVRRCSVFESDVISVSINLLTLKLTVVCKIRFTFCQSPYL
jgi:hypothetical protein